MRTRTGAYLDYLNEVLKRSKNVPIDIHINARSSTDLPHPVIDILLQHSERWGMLRLEACHAIIPLLQPAKGHLMSLRRLTLVFRWDREFQSASSHDLFQNAPALNDVYLENRAGHFILPPGQLISYNQSGNRLSEVLTLSITSLTTLILHGVTPTNRLPSITLPLLASLRITDNLGVAVFQCKWFLDNVTLPALKVLTIGETTDEIVKSVQLMIVRSHFSCKLESLVFMSEYFPYVSFTTLLERMPLLKFLSIPQPPLQDFHALTFDSSRPHLIPLLRELYLSVRGITEETKNILINLASSRCRPQPIPTCEDAFPMHVGDSQFEKLSLSFPNTTIAEQHLYGFEDWKEYDACAQLKRLGALLLNILPEYYERPNLQRSLLDVEWNNRLSALLDQIEAFVVEDPKDLAVRFSSPSLAFNLIDKVLGRQMTVMALFSSGDGYFSLVVCPHGSARSIIAATGIFKLGSLSSDSAHIRGESLGTLTPELALKHTSNTLQSATQGAIYSAVPLVQAVETIPGTKNIGKWALDIDYRRIAGRESQGRYHSVQDVCHHLGDKLPLNTIRVRTLHDLTEDQRNGKGGMTCKRAR
ncbi:hypothetical protein CVT25_002761 [Psilocybe cyanescens]|uniref:Uncharacterized protein n=1 Tax=Psilocybe cyanescens TaxID=93625 RepID=A0A409X5U0_PSICY|nr:hypothetical protein CVT25_002761 [Psilocybe cyanescens]